MAMLVKIFTSQVMQILGESCAHPKESSVNQVLRRWGYGFVPNFHCG